MNHTQKLKMARKMLTHKEVITHTSPFDGAKWLLRKDLRNTRELKKMGLR